MRKISVLILPLFVLVSGCATNLSHYDDIEKSIAKEKHEKAVDLLQKAKEEGQYEKKDRVLYSLEVGLAQHYAGLYEDSNERLSRADDYIDELYTKSISSMGYSFLTNSTELPYRGEPYENVYLNVFKAFNYANMGDRQGASVEIRKIDNKLGNMETRFKRMAEDYQESSISTISDQLPEKKDTEGDDMLDFSIGEVKFHSSALGRYLGYTSYLSQNDVDDARIDLNKMTEAFNNQPDIYNFDMPDLPREPLRDSSKARVNTVALLGKGPIKEQKEKRIEYENYQVKWVYPEIKKRGTTIDKVVVKRNGTTLDRLEKLEDINEVSEAVFNVKKPIIMTYNFVRALSKEIATEEVTENVSPIAGLAASLATQEFTENADLRTTRLLPGEVHVGHFIVPSGQQVRLKVLYYSDGEEIASETITRTFQHDDLNFLEVKNLI